MWRSLVAHTPGGRGVAGSNPVIPTKLHSNVFVERNLCSSFSSRHVRKNIILAVKIHTQIEKLNEKENIKLIGFCFHQIILFLKLY